MASALTAAILMTDCRSLSQSACFALAKRAIGPGYDMPTRAQEFEAHASNLRLIDADRQRISIRKALAFVVESPQFDIEIL